MRYEIKPDPKRRKATLDRIKSGYVTQNERRVAAQLQERIKNNLPISDYQREWLSLVEKHL